LKRLIKYLLISLPIIYILFIWTLSSLPNNAIINFNSPYDGEIKEILHLIEFGIPYALIFIAFLALGKYDFRFQVITLFLCIFLSAIDEIHQYFTPSRSTSFIDFAKDCIGIFVFFIVLKYFNNNEETFLGRIFKNMKTYFK